MIQNGPMKNNENEILQHRIKVIGNSDQRIDIYINILGEELIFKGMHRVKFSITPWEVFSIKKFKLGDNTDDINFEKIIKEVVDEMTKRHNMVMLVRSFLKEVDEVEIIIDQKKN